MVIYCSQFQLKFEFSHEEASHRVQDWFEVLSVRASGLCIVEAESFLTNGASTNTKSDLNICSTFDVFWFGSFKLWVRASEVVQKSKHRILIKNVSHVDAQKKSQLWNYRHFGMNPRQN